jgi:hypothetical protein
MAKVNGTVGVIADLRRGDGNSVRFVTAPPNYLLWCVTSTHDEPDVSSHFIKLEPLRPTLLLRVR